MARLAVALLILSAATAGCVGLSRDVHVFVLEDMVSWEGTAWLDVDNGPHCPDMDRDAGGYRYDRVIGDRIPKVMLYREWDLPLEAASSGSDRDWYPLGAVEVRASADPGRVLARVSWSDGLQVDGEAVDLPWNRTFAYDVETHDGTAHVTEALRLFDEGSRRLKVSTDLPYPCA